MDGDSEEIERVAKDDSKREERDERERKWSKTKPNKDTNIGKVLFHIAAAIFALLFRFPYFASHSFSYPLLPLLLVIMVGLCPRRAVATIFVYARHGSTS